MRLLHTGHRGLIYALLTFPPRRYGAALHRWLRTPGVGAERIAIVQMEAMDRHHEAASTLVYLFLGLPAHVDPAPSHVRPEGGKGAAARTGDELPQRMEGQLRTMFGRHRQYLGRLLSSPLATNVTTITRRDFLRWELVDADAPPAHAAAASSAPGTTSPGPPASVGREHHDGYLVVRTPHPAVREHYDAYVAAQLSSGKPKD